MAEQKNDNNTGDESNKPNKFVWEPGDLELVSRGDGTLPEKKEKDDNGERK